jgi:hypothetical protein
LVESKEEEVSMVETAVQMSIKVAEMPDVIDHVAEYQVFAMTKFVN